MPSDAVWKLKNARLVKVTRLPKVMFLRAQAHAGKFANYFDVKTFESVDAEEGDIVNMAGDLRMEKKRPGQGEGYELTMVLTELRPGDVAQAPPDNARRGKVTSSPPPDESDDDLPF